MEEGGERSGGVNGRCPERLSDQEPEIQRQ